MLILAVGLSFKTGEFMSNKHTVLELTLGNDLLQTHASSSGTNLIGGLKENGSFVNSNKIKITRAAY